MFTSTLDIFFIFPQDSPVREVALSPPHTIPAMYDMIFVRNTMQCLGKLMIKWGVEITYINN